MSESLLLKIIAPHGDLRIVAKHNDDISFENMGLKLIMASCWWKDLPVIETILSSMEKMIKHTIADLYEHNEITIDYSYQANDTLENASKIDIEINKVAVDGVEIEVIGRVITLEGIDKRGFFKKVFGKKTEEHIIKKL